MPVKQDRKGSRSRTRDRRPQRGRSQRRGGRPQVRRWYRASSRPWWHLPIASVVYLCVLGGLIVASLAVSSVFVVRAELANRSVVADETRREAALSAARQQALNFTTIGYETVDRDIDRVIGGATGDFKASYEQNRKTIKETVTKNKSTSKGEVLSAGLKSIDADSAVALVVVDASVTNVANKKPTLQNYRMQFDLAKLDNGKWLVSGVEFVG